MSERCGTCRHWRNPWEDWTNPDPDLVSNPERWGTCEAIVLPDRFDRDLDRSVLLAFTQDGSDYRADLHTRSDFGCVLWEGEHAARTSGSTSC